MRSWSAICGVQDQTSPGAAIVVVDIACQIKYPRSGVHLRMYSEASKVRSYVLTFITGKQAVQHCRWEQQRWYLEQVTSKKNMRPVTYQAVQPRSYHAQAASSSYPPATCAHAARGSSARIPVFLHFNQDVSWPNEQACISINER